VAQPHELASRWSPREPDQSIALSSKEGMQNVLSVLVDLPVVTENCADMLPAHCDSKTRSSRRRDTVYLLDGSHPDRDADSKS
jgi:hypothetical protein